MKRALMTAALAVSMSFGYVAIAPAVRAAAQDQRSAVADRKGTIKTINGTTLVMVPSDDKKIDATYELSADTKRSGTLAPGSEVEVRYYYQHGQRVVSEVIGRTR